LAAFRLNYLNVVECLFPSRSLIASILSEKIASIWFHMITFAPDTMQKGHYLHYSILFRKEATMLCSLLMLFGNACENNTQSNPSIHVILHQYPETPFSQAKACNSSS
jgi:hypothetical protein